MARHDMIGRNVIRTQTNKSNRAMSAMSSPPARQQARSSYRRSHGMEITNCVLVPAVPGRSLHAPCPVRHCDEKIIMLFSVGIHQIHTPHAFMIKYNRVHRTMCFMQVDKQHVDIGRMAVFLRPQLCSDRVASHGYVRHLTIARSFFENVPRDGELSFAKD